MAALEVEDDPDGFRGADGDGVAGELLTVLGATEDDVGPAAGNRGDPGAMEVSDCIINVPIAVAWRCQLSFGDDVHELVGDVFVASNVVVGADEDFLADGR